MKKYKVTFWRANPQLQNGGYETTKTVEAKTIKHAEKKAKDIVTGCLYGSMYIRNIAEVE